MRAESHPSPPAVDALLRKQGELPALRFITCGSVDDGKSTLIGRLLYDSQLLFDDQLSTLLSESKVYGTTGGDFDFALLLDGLQAEREQGITIDVAYRFFATKRRRFIVADTPGHEQYTRNMATGASNAEAAVVLVDARKGVVTQTRRHSYILGLLGVRHVLLAVNKMDLVDYDADRFALIAAEYRALAKRFDLRHVDCVPVVARAGDNVFFASQRMPWYGGSTVLDYLETVEVLADQTDRPFRMPVQWVNRPYPDFRGYSGRVASGRVGLGDDVVAEPSGRHSRVTRILTAAGDGEHAGAGQSVTLLLADEIDVGRGDVLTAGKASLVIAKLAAHLLWLDDQPMVLGASYVMKNGTRQLGAAITTLDHRVDIDSLECQAATTLGLNEIGHAQLTLDQPLVCEIYRDDREMGGFILIDRFSHRTVAAGMIDFALRRALDVPWQDFEVDKALRARLKHQRPCVLWFTGLSGAGKSTIVNLLDKRLNGMGRHCYVLDGDNLRNGLNRDLTFGEADRVENMRRVAEVAALFVDAGLIVLVSLISPFRQEREAIRMSLGPGEFIEIHVATPLAECERRDPKGHYRRVRAGTLKNFTGIDSPYEPPEHPDLSFGTTELSAEQAMEQVVAFLQAGRYI
ncbi:MAG TPA: adenylyl-sulfate kinase [Telmatospirillum sp.]|nr:adenylyl-sulfate kinase [Telmatospirillum sp.]